MRSRPAWRRLIVTAIGPLVLLLVALASLWRSSGAAAAPGFRPEIAALLALCAALAATSPRRCRADLALGTLALPPAVLMVGIWRAVLVALAAALARDLATGRDGVRVGGRGSRIAALGERCARVAGAVALAAFVWGAWRGAPGLPARAGAALAAYLVVGILGSVLSRSLLGASTATSVAGWTWEVAGWGLGTAAAVVLAARAEAAWVLLAGLAALAAEAGRQEAGRERAERRREDLRRLTRTVREGGTPGAPEAAVAQQVLSEVAGVVPARLYALEMLSDKGPAERWWAGADGVAATERPPLPPKPPARPGFHRAREWKRIERPLTSHGSEVGRLELWCDPRRFEHESLDLLGALLPQLAAIVERHLLGREARTDPLTGVAARRLLEARLEPTFLRARDEGHPMALVMCDLDHFKRINDTLGHTMGDAALAAVGRVLEAARRAGDLCARYGGEEFALLLDRTDGPTALKIADRLRASVEELEFFAEGRAVPLSVSAGVASFPEVFVERGEDLLVLADGALYEAKRRGRNRCLLDLGSGRYLEPSGREVESEHSRPPKAPPTLFA